MNFNKLMIGGLLVASVFGTGCSLEVKPDYALGIEDANAFPQDQLNGAMNRMYRVAYYGRNAYIFGDIGTDNIVEGANNSGRFIFESQMAKFEAMSNSVGSDETNLYDHIYEVVNNANRVIINDKATADQIGQAYFLRALATFDAVKFFDKVPLVLSPVMSITDAVNFKPENDEVTKIYAQVLMDLKMAQESITNTSVNAPTANAAYALASRVLLYIATEVDDFSKIEGVSSQKEAYEMAIAAADAVSGVELLTAKDYADYFYTQGKSSLETIFEIAVVESQSRGSDNFGNIYYLDKTGAGYGAYTANPEFVKMHSDEDVRKSMFVTVEEEKPGFQYVYKFAQSDGVTGLHAPKILRYSEVLLNKAEALAALGRGNDAASIIDQIRAARYTSNAPAVDVANIVEEVFMERRKELAYEGHYMFDLRRHNKGVQLVRLADNKGGSDEVEDFNEFVPAGDIQFWFPIPQRSMQANTSLLQPKYPNQ
ncbi:RagB/SusD family nutrient uptake outer membrane protein [Persicobacter psychrovividus]|uniref:RagB/SusD family nutrient uptake outer membrane protein n=1 Tax=Persicobacter psychrovividus TaxID=387638 RepID=A0ABN6L5B3_9BACT|nr:hypothetical protein PEPS_05440 [Persicobacter psychrovividus]